jgi:hypothetical protein
MCISQGTLMIVPANALAIANPKKYEIAPSSEGSKPMYAAEVTI